MRAILSIILVLFVLCVVSPSWALDTSTSGSKTDRAGKEQSQSRRKSMERRESTGRRKGRTTSRGIDRQTQEAIRAVEQAMAQTGAEVTLPLENIFIGLVADLERNYEPFRSCQVVTRPRLPKDFGLDAEVSPGVIDTIKAEYLQKLAQYNGFISDVADEKALKEYLRCIAYYGIILGQAYIYINSDLRDLKAIKIAEETKEAEAEIDVKGIGYDDFMILARAALSKVIRDGISDPIIRNMYERVTSDRSPCRFAGAVNRIQCGPAILILGGHPQMYVGGISWYGDGGYAGYRGVYRVSRAWSWSDALERMKSTARYARWATEVSRYAESLQAKGLAKEAILVKRRAWEIAKNGQQTVSPSKLLPGS